MAKKTKIISPVKGHVSRLAKEHNCSTDTVSRALSFVTGGDRADAIRRDCLKNYNGKAVTWDIPVNLK